MNVVDTSVVIAAFATWHVGHASAAEIVRTAPGLIAHSALESYSVLTRLPPPNRARPDEVGAFLARAFPGPWLTLPADELARLVPRMAELGIAGGSTYDALIGATAKHAGATLLTRDRRAIRIYERLGVTVRFVG